MRLRAKSVVRLLQTCAPDVLCLQECKTPVAEFPYQCFANAGYPHAVVRGQKGYNGVAIIARVPIEDCGQHRFCNRDDARHVAVYVPSAQVTIHNIYVPSGGGIPNLETNPKFVYKLQFLSEMQAWFAGQSMQRSLCLGDFNVALDVDDVWNHLVQIRAIGHTPIECAHLKAAQNAAPWVDVVRKMHPQGALYSWWTYRLRPLDLNKGWRFDYIWASTDLANSIDSAFIWSAPRTWERPSDHAPVFAEFNV